MIDLKDKLIKNKKMVFLASVGLCILAIDFYFVLKPVASGLVTVIPEASASVSNLKIMTTDVNNINNYKIKIEQQKEKLSGHKRKFSTKEEISPLLQNLSDTAKSCGVKIVSIKPMENLDKGSGKKTGAYRKFPIFLSAVSGYHSFGLFLSKLENSDTFMRITDLKIKGNDSGVGEHRFDVAVITYILSPLEATQEENKK